MLKAGEVRIAVNAARVKPDRVDVPSRTISGGIGVFLAGLATEAAGTVEAIGEGVQGFGSGDVVSTIPAFSQKDYGVYGELALNRRDAVRRY